MSAQSTFGLGRSKFRLGGSTLSCSASTALSRPAAPAAALRWPMFDLTEPSAIEPWRGARPCRTPRSRLPSSTASPTRVDVPCASMQVAGAGATPAFAPGALDRQPLADRVGRGDALALAVAGAADAAQHGVDAVAVALGVGQALEHEQRGALAHHEAVGAGVERPGAGGRQRADLAELHERRRRPCCGRRRR